MNKKGFTLVELIAVITILSVILIITIPIILKSRENAAKGLNKEEIANIKQTGKSIGIDLDDYNTDIYNCKDGSWLRDRCIKENGIWKKVTVTLDELREHEYLTDVTSKWDGLVIIENKTDTNEGYLVTLKENSSDVTLSNIYEITFDANGGFLTGDNKRKVLENEKYGEMPTPTREGYNFEGWYTSQEGGNKVNRNDIANSSNQILYAHWENKCKIAYPSAVTLTEKLISQANDSSITDYNSGTKSEMYTFSHPATEQTGALTDYRYIGSIPNNYITFNDEVWRIIGVFTVENERGVKEQSVKIVKDETIGDITWDRRSDGTAKNDWLTSALSTMLNSDYITKGGSFDYNWYDSLGNEHTTKINGLNGLAQSQIFSVKWYLGGNENPRVSGSEFYKQERGTQSCVTTGKCSGETRSVNTIAKAGLMYPSDYIYMYSLGIDNTCFTNAYFCTTADGGNPSAGWFFRGSARWMITAYTSYSASSMLMFGDGAISSTPSIGDINVQPTVYLRSNIKVISGNGSSECPYILN